MATRLFLERGFHKTSIRDIARACPFNLASLYMYVSSKEDILFLVAQQLIEEKAKAMAAVEILDDNPAELTLRTALRSYCRIVHDYRPLSVCFTANSMCSRPSAAKSPWRSPSSVTGAFEKIVRKGIDQGIFSNVEPELVSLERCFSVTYGRCIGAGASRDHAQYQRFFGYAEQDHAARMLTREPVAGPKSGPHRHAPGLTARRAIFARSFTGAARRFITRGFSICHVYVWLEHRYTRMLMG